ncbi:hypothetical protein KGF57_002660 [Candida theae]|uniref:Zn(2)-C6 fungal-type domain-containing protein n=1 Tax=Candida theae TaxID=1198502 RepID=A0AAD5FYU0_9ASCO|nr:uncharacterized protein KGF57_002660 [Candida theae]KAI5958305.1 hypothetical protein KGF57_002660 [Candida theae]
MEISQNNVHQTTPSLKLINTSSGVRVSQACDRCRIKKIKCDGLYPCHNCKKANFDCKTSDKLTRRAFPKGYTENLEKKVKALEEEVRLLRENQQPGDQGLAVTKDGTETPQKPTAALATASASVAIPTTTTTNDKVLFQTTNQSVQINNPIDQIFNLDDRGIIIGNDNLNFESQFNHLLINLQMPFLKITNSHNYLLNDPNSYLYDPSQARSNQFHNKDLDLVFNPLTGANPSAPDTPGVNELPHDVYDLFIKLINNFKKVFKSKKELDAQVTQFFLNYNIFIPIFDYHEFIQNYDAFHTMYPFIFTYDDSTINGFNLSNTSDYQIVNRFLMTIIQTYAMIFINNPTINLNLLLNHSDPHYSINRDKSILNSLYDILPYFNGFQISISQLQTYLLLLYYSLLTNNKEKSLILSSLVNAFIGILGINLNSKNLFFNDLSLNVHQRRNRVKIFWTFKVLLKCFNLKFGFKPSLNTTVINPVTIDRYFQLTPEKLSSLLDDNDDLFNTLLKPSIEFLNLMNIIIPSSFSPNYYQYLKLDKKKKEKDHPAHSHNHHRLDWILNEDDGDGNDGNLNYNFNQFLTIDKNLSDWRQSLKHKVFSLTPLNLDLGLPNLVNVSHNNLYHDMTQEHLKQEVMLNYYQTGLPDTYTASQLIKIQLNFHYVLIRSMNYLNFIVDKELDFVYYKEIAVIASEVLQYFNLIFYHISLSHEKRNEDPVINSNAIVMQSLGLDVDEDGFVINDFSVKRRRSNAKPSSAKRVIKEIPMSPFNPMLNGLSLTVINLKKCIVLQMLYLLICQMKCLKRQELIANITESVHLLHHSVDLFITIFLNYKPGVNSKRTNEDVLFDKLMKDELKVEILQYQQQRQQQSQNDDTDDEEDADVVGLANGKGPNYYKSIDWDNENLDEDLKYLKICKFIKYKSQSVLEQYNKSKVKQKTQNQSKQQHQPQQQQHQPQQQQHQPQQQQPPPPPPPPQQPHPHPQPHPPQQQPLSITQNPYTPMSSSTSGSATSLSIKFDVGNAFPDNNNNNNNGSNNQNRNDNGSSSHKDFGAAHDLMDLKRSYSNRNLSHQYIQRNNQSI